MEQPIACSLDAVAARDQLDEWQALVDGGALAGERPNPTELLMHLDRSRVADVVDLAQREKACCPFFDFSLRMDADAIVLRIAVPPEASAILDGFDLSIP